MLMGGVLNRLAEGEGRVIGGGKGGREGRKTQGPPFAQNIQAGAGDNHPLFAPVRNVFHVFNVSSFHLHFSSF